MFLAYIAMAAFLWQTPGGSSSVSVKDNEIWLQTASGERQLTHDSIPKRLPTLSPSGNDLMYVVDHPQPNDPPKEEIVLLGLEGDVRKRITPEGYVPREFDRLDWIDEHRIGALACGHANCMYWVMNPQSGKTVQVMSGGFDFVWSHNRLFAARLWAADGGEWADDYDAPEHDAVLFNHDDVLMYPPERAGGHCDNQTHNIGIGADPRFVWSPDDKWVAFTDLIGPEEDWYVVILSPSGKMFRDTLPIDPDYKATLEWRDDTHLDLRTSKRVFHFALQGEQFSEIRGASSGPEHP